MQPANKTVVRVQEPLLKPKFTNIGYGNPRYNSLVVCPDENLLLPCGSSLRIFDLINNKTIFDKQVGHSQIFQLIENKDYLMIVNFEGLVSLVQKNTLDIKKQFRIGGKEIRHSSISEKFIAVSCQLLNETKQAVLEIYSLAEINKIEGVSIQVKPIYSKIGFYYFPQIVEESVYFIQYLDPNPKGKSRTQTVLDKKLPIRHKIYKKNISVENLSEQIKEAYNIVSEGEILCACLNIKTNQIFYLNENKKIIVFHLTSLQANQISFVASGAPHCIQLYKDGVIYASQTSELTYFEFKENSPQFEQITLNLKGITTSYCIKTTPANNFAFFNQNGLQYYNNTTKQVFTQNLFDITNCGISLSQDGSQFAVADFGGNVFIFSTNQNGIPNPLGKVSVGIPVRSLAWCYDTNKIVIGCVGGYLFSWDGISQQAQVLFQTNDHTINNIRYFKNLVLFGTSDGFVHIMHSETLEQLYRFQAHTPIHYQNQKDRELFGSMKNYAEIWSLVTFQSKEKNSFYLVTCSQDQTQKVFLITIEQNGGFNHKQEHHLVGHSLAVTSIDWKVMGKGLGSIYVSCSDDKIVRFRNPENTFEIIHELETSTIKQWHTLTYLCLQPNGHRVAIGSQNGYLFIFDIESKELLYGQKIHLGGIEGLDWVNGKLITCSSDLCITVTYL